jgi:hypothetical protein
VFACEATSAGGLTCYGRVDLLCIDELGYMELDRRGAELLFQVLTEREEKNSVAIASNESFSGWTKTFTDPRLCAAIVDRLTFNGAIIQTGTESYRLAHTKAVAERAEASCPAATRETLPTAARTQPSRYGLTSCAGSLWRRPVGQARVGLPDGVQCVTPCPSFRVRVVPVVWLGGRLTDAQRWLGPPVSRCRR